MSYIENLRMEAVENGYKVYCVERYKALGEGHFSDMAYDPKEFVYSSKEGSKAMAKFEELASKMKSKEKKESKGE